MPAPAAIDQTAIVNKAQILLGQAKRFVELADDDQKAIDYKTLWPIAARRALSLHPWNFAIARATINADKATPAHGYAYRYRLPGDCLRYLPWARGDDDWFDGAVEGGFILTDQPGAIRIRYIGLTDNPADWPPIFCDLMAYTLAMEGCEGSTARRGLYQDLNEAREALLIEARRMDALESGNRMAARPMVASRWAGARYSARGWSR